MGYSAYSPKVTGCISFFILIIAIPLITYPTFFKERMDPDPHGVGAFLFIIFILIINPFVSLCVSFGIWAALTSMLKKMP